METDGERIIGRLNQVWEEEWDRGRSFVGGVRWNGDEGQVALVVGGDGGNEQRQRNTRWTVGCVWKGSTI